MDLTDEEQIQLAMSKVPYLTEQQIEHIEEQKKRNIIIEQKNSLRKYQN